MLSLAHPEVLADGWLPPVPLHRRSAVDEVVRRLDPPLPRASPPWIVGVAGSSGSGTSVVARRAAREVSDRIRSCVSGSSPRILWMRLPTVRGTHGVATGLLRRLDEGFDGRGFPVPEVLAGFLRRLRREGRPTVLVLDDVGVSAADLVPVVLALGRPDRFLPEGESGLPPLYTIVAGRPNALDRLAAGVPESFSFTPFVSLEPYSETALTEIVRDRAERALGRPMPAERVASIVARSVEEGGGARQAFHLLRRALLGSSLGPFPSLSFPVPSFAVAIEPRVVRAIGAATGGVAGPVADVRRLEAELARSQGLRPLPTTTLWRRIVRLEAAGYVRREIRTGGDGGTRSVVRVLTPIDEWVTDSRRPGTPRGFARSGLFGFAREEPAGRPRPDPELPGLGGVAD